jgi:hypothetical protein
VEKLIWFLLSEGKMEGVKIFNEKIKAGKRIPCLNKYDKGKTILKSDIGTIPHRG